MKKRLIAKLIVTIMIFNMLSVEAYSQRSENVFSGGLIKDSTISITSEEEITGAGRMVK